MGRIKVLIVDDSAVMRQFLSEVLSAVPDIEVVATAMDAYIAANKINKLIPDVVTLDIEMPRMDGLTFLSKLMNANPLPVIMVSSFTEMGAQQTMKALELGAVDFILKPALDNQDDIKKFTDTIVEKIFVASKSKIKRKREIVQPVIVEKKLSADAIIKKRDPRTIKSRSERVITLGASTGGTEVIDKILTSLPENMPGIVITQHMPEKFTKAFADRVNEKAKILVKEAENNERLYKGVAFIAPGGKHMLLHADANGYFVEINDGPPVNRHKPSVDVLFRSVSQCAGKYAVGIICTGMGNDGAAGMLELKQSGAITIAQDEASSVVYGMPNEAVKLGAVDMERNIEGIIAYLHGVSDQET